MVYAVHNQIAFDEQSRVNTFVHVNNTEKDIRNGVLMCLNGTGILNSWLRSAAGALPYEEMNALAGKAPAGEPPDCVSILLVTAQSVSLLTRRAAL